MKAKTIKDVVCSNCNRKFMIIIKRKKLRIPYTCPHCGKVVIVVEANQQKGKRDGTNPKH